MGISIHAPLSYDAVDAVCAKMDVVTMAIRAPRTIQTARRETQRASEKTSQRRYTEDTLIFYHKPSLRNPQP